jgi:ribosome maturation factor RimP
MPRLETEVQELLETEGVMLLDFSAKQISHHLQIRVIADRKVGGLTIEDCVKLARQIKWLIAEKNLLTTEDYRLEITSPGLDYPLRERWQFEKNIGRLLKIRVPGEKGPKELSGRLIAVREHDLSLNGEKQEWQLNYSDCLNVVVLPEFNSPSRPAVGPHKNGRADKESEL